MNNAASHDDNEPAISKRGWVRRRRRRRRRRLRIRLQRIRIRGRRLLKKVCKWVKFVHECEYHDAALKF